MRKLWLIALVVTVAACGGGTDSAQTIVTTGETITSVPPTTGGDTTTSMDATTVPTTRAPETTTAPETTSAPTTAAPTTTVAPTTTSTTSTTSAPTTTNPGGSDEILSPSGFWEVRIGETVGENEARMGLALEDLGGDPNHCMIFELPEVGGIYFIGSTLNEEPVDGRDNLVVARVSADSPGWVSENGIEVGMSVEDAESVLGDTITERKPHFYVEGGEYLIVGPADSRYVFETDGEAITAIHAGMEPVVSYVEACS